MQTIDYQVFIYYLKNKYAFYRIYLRFME